MRGIRNDPPERYRRLLEQARADKDRAERDLAEHSARFRDDRVEQPRPSSRSRGGAASRQRAGGLRQVSASGLADAMAKRPARSEPSYLAFVLRGGDSRPALVPLGSAARSMG